MGKSPEKEQARALMWTAGRSVRSTTTNIPKNGEREL